MPDYASAIAAIESGGKYGELGPVTRTGDRAYGKFQIMGSNIGPWTEAALGRRLTPQEFLASPQAQDAVFQHRFGQYANKYGPEMAARAWFAGEKGMHNPNAKDQLGTTVESYGRRFMGHLGQPTGAPAPSQGLLASNPPQGSPESPGGLLAGQGLAQMGMGLMGGQMPAPPPMLPPMPRRPIDLSALRALAGLG